MNKKKLRWYTKKNNSPRNLTLSQKRRLVTREVFKIAAENNPMMFGINLKKETSKS
jgi:hypothetical protein